MPFIQSIFLSVCKINFEIICCTRTALVRADFKNFLGGMPPDTPSLGVVKHTFTGPLRGPTNINSLDTPLVICTSPLVEYSTRACTSSTLARILNSAALLRRVKDWDTYFRVHFCDSFKRLKLCSGT